MDLSSIPRWLGWVWIAAGAVTIVMAVLAAVLGWRLIGGATDAAGESIGVTRQLLVTVADTTTAVDVVFEDVAGSLRDVQLTLADASLTFTRASVLTDGLGELVAVEVPASIDAVTASLPALIDTAGVIDATMRGLSFFGLDYDAEVPLDDSIREIEGRLSAIPPLLRRQQDTVEAVADDLGAFGSTTTEISDDLGSIRARLVEASRVVEGYARITADTDELLVRLDADLAAGTSRFRTVVVLAALGIAVTQTAPMVLGWAVLRQPPPAGAGTPPSEIDG